MDNSRLSRIETLWSVVRRAHESGPAAAKAAQEQLLNLYGGAIRRYLLASLRDPDLADELFQSFAVQFVEGTFRNADPDRGRFRSFVKTVLYRMIAQHYRGRAKVERQHLEDLGIDAASADQTTAAEDEQFLLSWREQILEQTWQALAAYEAATGAPYHSLLRLRTAHPALSSEALADQFGRKLDKPMTAGATRIMLHRAREKFANLLIDVTAESLQTDSAADVEEELSELRLKVYCRDALDLRISQENENPA